METKYIADIHVFQRIRCPHCGEIIQAGELHRMPLNHAAQLVQDGTAALVWKEANSEKDV